MPKEITHWMLAENAARAIQGDAPLGKLLQEYRSYYLLGAVIYDTPYSFLGLTKRQKEFKKVADKLHGAQGQDAFCPFKNMFEKLWLNRAEGIYAETLAFTLGFLSHIVVDLNFHPMIFYLTGNYYSKDKQERDQAVSNHRWLETEMDLWFLQEKKEKDLQPTLYLKEILKGIEAEKLSSILAKFVEAVGLQNQKKTTRDYLKAVKYHAFFQKVFFVDWVRAILAFILGKKHKTVALFYSKPKRLKGEKIITYRHPVTGFSHEITLTDLRNNTEGKLVKVFAEIDSLLARERSAQTLQTFLSSLPEHSIETGVARTSSKDMKFFSDSFNRLSWFEQK